MDVAIVGMGCRLPGGVTTPDEFWTLLRGGVDAITDVPPDRFDLAEAFDPDPAAPGKVYSRRGGFVPDLDRFDADFFGIAPREARRMDPQHRLLLEVAWEALEEGGHVPERLAGTSTGVFVGISTHDYGDLQMGPEQRPLHDAHVNIGNALCVAANRLSYLLDVRGPSMAVETACSSSLTAVHLACQSVTSGESSLAVAAGVNAVLAPDLTIGFCKASMISPDGRCYAFDARANGYVRSEGAGAVVLKPLESALADGDRIHAIVRGTAVNEDGRTAGISLPSTEAQRELLHQALRSAAVSASALQYVEAHGTGTAAGDPIEAGAIGQVMGAGRLPGSECVIGSVKTNVGHLEAGAGITGLIKTALMLRHREIAPTLHFTTPNPAIPFGDLGLRVATQREPWPACDGPAMASVNSFGFGGANAHVVLEEPPAPPRPGAGADRDAGSCEVLTISGRTPGALAEAARRHRDLLAADAAPDLRDACSTAATRRTHHEHRLAAVGRTAAELAGSLDAFLAGNPAPAVLTGRCSRNREPKLAFVFAGMGPQWWGMGQQLLGEEPAFRTALEECDEVFRPLGGWSLLDELGAGEAASRLGEARVVQVVNCAFQIALAALWRSWGVVPDAVVGHSAGEVAAAHVAGALDLDAAFAVAFHRGRLLHRATGTGTMLAAGVSPEEARTLAGASGDRVSLAAVNSSTSVTLSGDATALEEIAASLERQERFCRFLPVDVPYHGPQMEAIRDELLEALAGLRPGPPTVPLVSGLTGTWVDGKPLDGDYWWQNMRQPVLFGPAVDTLVAGGWTLYCEIGPHPVLAAYVTERLAEAGADGTVLPTLRRDEDERETVLRSAAALHVRGRRVDWRARYPDGRCVPLPTYPWQRERHWFETPAAGARPPSGVDTGHPLLGRRLPSAHPTWESDLADPRVDYLDAHVVDGAAVFPGAGYVEAGLAAARQLVGDGVPARLEGVEFRKLLFLDAAREHSIQVLFQPRDGALEIHSAPRDRDPQWTLHATAVVHEHDRADPSGDREGLAAPRERCTEPVDVAACYRTFERFGFSYGSPFRGLLEAWSGQGEALARLGFPAGAELPVDAYGVHPALLDAGYQLLVAAAVAGAAAGGLDGPLLPVSIRRVTLHHDPGARPWAHARVRVADHRAIEGDVKLLDASGEVALTCEGVRLELLDAAPAHERDERDERDDRLYELGWQEAPLAAPDAPGAARVGPAGEAPALLEASAGPEHDPRVEAYHEIVAPALDRVASGFTRLALAELGWLPERDGDQPVEALARSLGVAPARHRLLAALAGMAGAGGHGAPPDRAALHADLDALVARAPGFAAEAELLRRGGDALPGVLRGDADVREAMLDADGLELMGRMYHASPGCQAYHRALASAVAASLDRAGSAPGGAPTRVLEVGAGTGAATAALLEQLPGPVEYTFTDVSPHFLQAARARFGSREGVRFAVLDIEAEPGAQGFESGSFDAVVAANVVHATANLRASLGHLRRLLVPGGLLALLELEAHATWFTLVFGLLDGWWRFTDPDLRGSGPLLPGDGWRRLLEACGYTGAARPFEEEGDNPVQSVVLARAPVTTVAPAPPRPGGWLVLADDGGTGAGLAGELRDRGEDCTLVRRGHAYRRLGDGSFELPPADTAAATRLLGDLEAAGKDIEGIVHLWSLDAAGGDGTGTGEVMGSQALGCGSVLALVQALDGAGGDAPPIWLVTAGAQPVEGHDAAPNVAQAPLWGLGRVLMNEQSVSRCRLVDLGPGTDRASVRSAPADRRHEARTNRASVRSAPADRRHEARTNRASGEVAALATELVGGGADEEIALRGGQRFVRRLERARLGAARRGHARPRSADGEPFRLEIGTPGALESLVLRDAPAAEPGPGEVAIRVRASGLVFRDVLQALGMLPHAALGSEAGSPALGVECSGVVVACGEGVEEFRPGDEVCALAWGAHGSRVVTRASLTVHKPEELGFTEAASVVNAFVTAEYALGEVARLAPGERVLLHSAAGAVGLAAVQYCRRVGAEVFATAGTPEKRAYLTSLGVEHVLDSRSLAFADEVRARTGGEGVDVVLNSLGGEAMRASLDLLRPYGRFVELGKRDIYSNAHVGLLPFKRNLTYTAVDLIQFALDRPERAKRMLIDAVGRVADGTYTPVPCTTYDLGQAEEAFRLMAQARHVGKVVLTVDEPRYQAEAATEQSLCVEDGTYLVTGGLGGLGLAVAAWLVRHGARHIVLLSRSGKPAGGEEALAALRDSPARVTVVRADAGEEADVARVLDGIRRDGPPLRGVVHAAMVLDDDLLVRLDLERFRAVLAPKVAGAWNLHRLTAGDDLDFFVLFSSIAAMIGHPMQGNYAAANAFLDALAAHRKGLGLPALCIGWGAVAGAGYVARHPAIADYLERSGFTAFTPEEALDVLGTLLRHDRAHVVAAGIDWGALRETNPLVATSRRFTPFMAGGGPGEAPDGDGAASPLERVSGAAPPERQEILEGYLATRIARVLGGAADRVDVERPLTGMGFDSLMAVELTTAIKSDLRVRLPATKVLQGASPRELAASLVEAVAGESEDPDGGEQADGGSGEPAWHPTSPEQRRLWFLHRLDPEDPAYNIPIAARLSGELDVGALRRSLDAAVERHEVLRATFTEIGGEPVQAFGAPFAVPLPVVDLDQLPEADREVEMQRRATAETRRPLDLETGPLLRAALFRLAPREHVLLLVVHHIACDAWSMNWLAREIAALYEAFSAGRASPLDPPPFRYVDYVEQEAQRLEGDLLARQLDYWTRRLAGTPDGLRLPGARTAGAAAGRRGAHRPVELPPELTAALEDLARGEGATLFMTLLAGFQVLLGRWAGQDDVPVASPISTRTQPGAEAVGGCFMNTLVLRGDLRGDPTFRELLRRTRATTLEAYEHQDVPFERVVEALGPARGSGRSPLFEAMLVLHNLRLPELAAAGLEIAPVDVESGTAVADLVLLLDTGDGLTGTLEYDADRFDPATVDALLEQFETLLRGIASDPDRPLSALPLAGEVQQRALLAEWTGAAVDAGEPRCLHELVEAQAARTPGAVAVERGQDRLTYAQLDRRANRLARELRRLGTAPGAVAGICLPPSPAFAVAALAVLKAGAAYLPLDPGHPPRRLHAVLDDARAAAVIAAPERAEAFAGHGPPVLTPDTSGSAGERDETPLPPGGAGPDDLAYVLYTSGSSGRPKGVMVSHRAVYAHLCWRQGVTPLDASDAVLQRTPLTFDPSVWELFGPLAAGARVVVPPDGADIAALARLVAAKGVTVLQAVPAVLDALLAESGIEDCRTLRHVVCGGEPLRPDLAERFLALLPAALHHVYGPTEGTIEATCWTCRRGDDRGLVPIGRPAAGTAVAILDGRDAPVPVGVAGELCLAGPGLARGYLRRPGTTAERFVPNPFPELPGTRLYRTGDLGRWRPDGTIEFVGRTDEQVKVRGVRVEPGEVEAVLARHPAVGDVAVVAPGEAPGERRLVGCVVAQPGERPDAAELRRFAAAELPEALVPSAVVAVGALPRTASGKVDRRLLARSEEVASASDTASGPAVGPRDGVELQLLRIWESFLPGQAVGVTHDFFEIGGHSLLAMRVMAEVRERTGADLPVSSLLEARTIERLAARMREGLASTSPLVAVQQGPGRPFFCVHPVSGTVLCYAALARALGEDVPFFGLEAAGLAPGREPSRRIEEMAASYLEAIRGVQARGPYRLGGWSMGGTVAFEMARQLAERGEEVEVLALIDSAPPGVPVDGEGQGAALRGFVENLGLSPDELTVSVRDFWRLDRAGQLACVLEHARAAGLVPPNVEADALERQLAVFTANLEAMRAYVPRPHGGRLTLVETAASRAGAGQDGHGWDALAGGGVERLTIPGDHYSVLREPDVAALAQHLRGCLDRPGAPTPA